MTLEDIDSEEVPGTGIQHPTTNLDSRSCEACDYPVKAGWNYCPSCGHYLSIDEPTTFQG